MTTPFQRTSSDKRSALPWMVVAVMTCLVGSASVAAQEPALSLQSQAQIEVDLQLVIATDVSGSIDGNEAFLQRKGVSDAFRTKDIIDAIEAGGLGRIGVVYVDFSSQFYNRVVVDWQLISDQASSFEFANMLMRIPRTRGQGTSLSDAIEFGMALFEVSPFWGGDKVIDISGDGPNRSGRPLLEVRDEAVQSGIVINGLPILDPYGFDELVGLDLYFAGCVIGGPGSFIQAAHGVTDFSRAIRRKLVLELSRAEPESGPLDRPRLIRVAQPGVLPQLPNLAPPEPTYNGPCDSRRNFR